MRFQDSDLETKAHNLLSLTEPLALIRRFSKLTRESGSADERAAGMYIADRLRDLGVPVTVHEPELYLSIPERSEVRVRRRRQPDDCGRRPPSFARSTNGEEVSGELVYVPSTYAGGTADLFDTPMSAARPSIGARRRAIRSPATSC